MIRASLYLCVAGVVWFVEGYLFSRFLQFSPAQSAVAAAVYLTLFVLVIRQLLRALGRDLHTSEMARWRYLSLAPMATVVLGSFASLPILLVIVALGKVL